VQTTLDTHVNTPVGPVVLSNPATQTQMLDEGSRIWPTASHTTGMGVALVLALDDTDEDADELESALVLEAPVELASEDVAEVVAVLDSEAVLEAPVELASEDVAEVLAVLDSEAVLEAPVELASEDVAEVLAVLDSEAVIETPVELASEDVAVVLESVDLVLEIVVSVLETELEEEMISPLLQAAAGIARRFDKTQDGIVAFAVNKAKTRSFLTTQNRARLLLKASLDHTRRSDTLKVVETSPIACEVSKVPDAVPLFVETSSAFGPESCPLVMVNVAA
jgi:hypothetical protein